MGFSQQGDISILNGSSLKLVDKFTYLGSSVSSTENDYNSWLANEWTAIDRLSVIWKSDLSDKIKRYVYNEKARRELHENAMSYVEQILEATSHKTAPVRASTSYL